MEHWPALLLGCAVWQMHLGEWVNGQRVGELLILLVAAAAA